METLYLDYLRTHLQAKNIALQVHDDLNDMFQRYATRENAIPDVVHKNEKLLSKLVTAFDTFDDLLLWLEKIMSEEKVRAYQNGYEKGKRETKTPLAKPSRFYLDREKLRQYTVALALQESEQIELESYGMSSIFQTLQKST